MRANIYCLVTRCCGLLLAFGWIVPAAGQPSASERAVVLTEGQHWRKFYVFSRPVYEGENLPAVPQADPPFRDSVYDLFSKPPPSDWTKPDFDDSLWLLCCGREFTSGIKDARLQQGLDLSSPNAALRGTDPFFVPVGVVYLRGRFWVNDRTKVHRAAFVLAYRGGFVAHLNGVEVARSHLPEGALSHNTAATVYPAEAFFYANTVDSARPRPLDPKDLSCKQWILSERSFGPIELPLRLLRDGVNVLAIEIHRAAYPALCARFATSRGMAGLASLELAVEPAVSVTSSPPRSILVWTPEVTRTLVDPDWSRLNEPPGPVSIAAVRNGTFSGQVVVSSGAPSGIVNGLSARVSRFLHKNGRDALPAESVRLRFAVPNPLWPKALDNLGLPVPAAWKYDAGLAGGTRLDLLLDAPPENERVVGIWVTVSVPRTANPGEYSADLALQAKGLGTATVPLRLRVCDWTLPDLRDFASLINIYQSPETLAMYYRVTPWSDEHWALIRRSMELMGEMGNCGIFIPLLAESQMGNPESMVPWIKQADGSYGYDFARFDRYLDLAVATHQRLEFISLNVWGYEASLRTWRGPRDYDKFYGARVTVVDPARGTRESMKLPRYGTPECEALWRPLLTELRARLEKKELGGKILLGLAGDQYPDPDTVAMFHRILPGAGWIAESHQLTRKYVYDTATGAAVPVRYNSIVYGADIPDPATKTLYGWQRNPEILVMNFNRSGSCLLLMGYPPPWSFRMWMESTLACGRNGNGRVGGDYWRIGAEIIGEGQRDWGVIGGSGGSLFGRYMHSHADEAGLGRSCTDLFGPGPNGPVSTVRLENAREGNQEAEARVFIEKALLDKTRPLPPDLVQECNALLRERTNILRLWKMGAASIAPQAWQERTLRLYELAARVEAARKRHPRPSR